MTARDLLHVSRLDEPTARLALELLHRLETAWANHPADREFCLSRLVPDWLDLIAKELAVRVSSPSSNTSESTAANQPMAPVPLPTITGPVHADLRRTGLALALDLIELCALYPKEPADWVGRLALDRRTRTSFPKGQGSASS